jgi:hypothetical protein
VLPERGPHLAEIEWHGVATIDLLDAMVDILDQLLALPQQVDGVVESFVTIVIEAGGNGTAGMAEKGEGDGDVASGRMAAVYESDGQRWSRVESGRRRELTQQLHGRTLLAATHEGLP